MTITAKFDSICKACGAMVKTGQRCDWVRGVKGVKHATINDCAAAVRERNAAPPAPPKPSVTANAKPFADFLRAARDRGLKFPKVAFVGPQSSELKMTLAGANSKNPGAVFVYQSGEYVGSIAADGVVRGRLSSRADLLTTIAAIATDPAGAAKAYGMLTGRCSFCAKELTDAGSVEVGYGPVCARKFGLPHTPARRAKMVEVAIDATEPPDLDDYAREVGREPLTAETIPAAESALFGETFEFDAEANADARAHR